MRQRAKQLLEENPDVKFYYKYIHIYKLYCLDSNIKDIYIGRTINMKKMMRDHSKAISNKHPKHDNRLVYKFIRDHGGYINWDCKVLESTHTCNLRDEKLMHKKWIEFEKPSLNSVMVGRSSNEYYQTYKDQINAKRRYKRSQRKF
jgi:hypothetical protein